VFLILQTRKKSRLTEPIHLNQFHAGKNLSNAMDQIGRNRRTSVSQSFKTRQVIVLQVFKLSQHIDHRWNHYRVRYVFTFHDLAECLRTKLRNRGLTGAESRRCKHEGKVRDVKHGRGVEIDTSFSVTHPVVDMVHVRENVCVGERYSFRRARSAARINQGKNCIGIVDRVGSFIVLKLKRFSVNYSLPVKLHRRHCK
jgi:hypothetical protein